tara:strand:+ start:7218 stop:7700 length:483 start_codon:yes stop_codon:yes gene_type:complete
MHFKQNNKESKSYVQGLRPFGNTLPRGIKGILKKNGYNYSEIIGKWNILIGNSLSSYCYPKSIKVERENKKTTLIIAVKRGNEITLEYSKKEIIDKINSYFGYKLIDQIRLITANSESKKIKKVRNTIKTSEAFEKKIDKIENKEIKESLSKLLEAFKNG